MLIIVITAEIIIIGWPTHTHSLHSQIACVVWAHTQFSMPLQKITALIPSNPVGCVQLPVKKLLLLLNSTIQFKYYVLSHNQLFFYLFSTTDVFLARVEGRRKGGKGNSVEMIEFSYLSLSHSSPLSLFSHIWMPTPNQHPPYHFLLFLFLSVPVFISWLVSQTRTSERNRLSSRMFLTCQTHYIFVPSCSSVKILAHLFAKY